MTALDGMTKATEHAAPRHWLAQLSLGFVLDGERTVLSRRRHQGPLRVQRSFHPEPDGTCHVYLLHPPGGLAGGDELAIEARVGPGASVLLTTPSASKFYDTFELRSQQHAQLHVLRDGCLEWLPQETIVFDGADSALCTRVELETGASFAGLEVVCLGRPACGERFLRGRLQQRFEITREGRPLFVERGHYRGGDSLLAAPYGLSEQPVLGTLVWVGSCEPALLQALRRELTPAGRPSRLALTALRDVLVCRYLGPSTQEALSLLRAVWARLRGALWQRGACAPRIWAT